MYFAHRPSNAKKNLGIRASWGKIEIWQMSDNCFNNFFDNNDNDNFQRCIFVIPMIFMGQFVSNLQDLRFGLCNRRAGDSETPIICQFGYGGIIESKLEKRKTLKKRIKIKFTFF